jgi:hypothetical protein
MAENNLAVGVGTNHQKTKNMLLLVQVVKRILLM